MTRLIDAAKLVAILANMHRSAAWLGREVGRSRQRMWSILTDPTTTLPQSVADRIEAAVGVTGLFERVVR